MATANEDKKTVKELIGGSEVRITFAAGPNPTVAELVKKALLDSYLQKSSARDTSKAVRF